MATCRPVRATSFLRRGEMCHVTLFNRKSSVTIVCHQHFYIHLFISEQTLCRSLEHRWSSSSSQRPPSNLPSHAGQSRCWINSSPAAASTLRTTFCRINLPLPPAGWPPNLHCPPSQSLSSLIPASLSAHGQDNNSEKHFALRPTNEIYVSNIFLP